MCQGIKNIDILKENQRELKENIAGISKITFFRGSTSESFQDTMSAEITQDIPGYLNISNDILVYEKNQQEHDLNSEKLFKKAREKKITFNKGNCEFNKQSCVYYGIMEHPLTHKRWRLSGRPSLLAMRRNWTHSYVHFNTMRDL